MTEDALSVRRAELSAIGFMARSQYLPEDDLSHACCSAYICLLIKRRKRPCCVCVETPPSGEAFHGTEHESSRSYGDATNFVVRVLSSRPLGSWPNRCRTPNDRPWRKAPWRS